MCTKFIKSLKSDPHFHGTWKHVAGEEGLIVPMAVLHSQLGPHLVSSALRYVFPIQLIAFNSTRLALRIRNVQEWKIPAKFEFEF